MSVQSPTALGYAAEASMPRGLVEQQAYQCKLHLQVAVHARLVLEGPAIYLCKSAEGCAGASYQAHAAALIEHLLLPVPKGCATTEKGVTPAVI
jgi:hypothetical protein